ncbi:MAG: hypothetical protein ABSG17_02700 [Spirochaetia bacterium]|jgi:hypothetical protein
MPSKKLTVMMIALVLSASVFADDTQEGPEAFSFVFGPRIGGSYVATTPESFTSSVNAFYPGNYVPAVTLFGVTLEQRILLGQTRSHFAFQEVLLIGGLEQGVALPEGAFLIGYRDYSGFEFGIGPILHVGGISVIAALGWTFSFSGAYVPVDVSLVIPNAERPASISITTGFNFQVSRRERQVVEESQKTQGAQKSDKTQEPQAPQSSK